MNVKGLILLISVLAGVWILGCDIYENEEKDWENRVTISVSNLTICPLDITLDGSIEGRLESGESETYEELGQGVHMIEAYPWNNSDYSCAFVITSELENDESYHWDILDGSACNACDPTPTPEPEETPTPSPSPSATPGS